VIQNYNMHKTVKFVFLYLILMLSSIVAYSQRSSIKYYNTDISRTLSNDFEFSDTTLNNVQIFSPIYKRNNANLNLGNIGQPWLSLDGVKINSGFNLGLSPYKNYMINPDEFMYIVPHKNSCTDIKYMQGLRSNGVVSLDLVHTQYIKKKYPFALVLNRLGSTGNYLHQNTDWYNTQIMGNIYNKDSNYILVYRIAFSKGSIEHNGGIQDTGNFDSTAFDFRNYLPVNLNNALSKLSSKQIQFVQGVSFGKRKEKSDTIAKKQYKYRLTHYTTFYTFKHLYSDDSIDGLTYPYRNYNAASSDSVTETRLSNRLVFAPIYDNDANMKSLHYSLYVDHSYYSIRDSNKAMFNNIKVGGDLSKSISNLFKLSGKGYYYLNGYNQNDYHINLSLTKDLFKRDTGAKPIKYLSLWLNVTTTKNEADYLAKSFYSNHYNWHTSLDKVELANLKFNITNLFSNNGNHKTFFKQSLSFDYYMLKNYVYYNPLSMPTQYKGTITGTTVNYSLTGMFRKHFGFNFNANYNFVSDNYYLRLPKYATKTSVYYVGKYFKSPMNYQVGVDVFWFSQIQSYLWNPVAGVFYFDNRHMTGNYPLMDLFFNAEIYQVQLYLKLEHALWGLPTQYQFLPEQYYSATAFPMQPRAIRFGIRWRFGG